MQVTPEHEEAQAKAECRPVAPSKTQFTGLFLIRLFESLYLKLAFVGSSCAMQTATSVSQEVAQKGGILDHSSIAVSQPAHSRAPRW